MRELVLRHRFGLMRMASSVGDVLGPLLVLWSLRAVFLAATFTLLTAAIVVAFYLQETHGVLDTDSEDDDELSAFVALLHDRRLALILVSLSVIQIAISWIEAVLPLSATQDGVLAPAGIGWLFAHVGLLGVLFQMPILRLCINMPGSRTVVLVGTLLTLALGALAFMPSLVGFIVAATGLAFGGILLRPMVQAVVLEIAPAKARAPTRRRSVLSATSRTPRDLRWERCCSPRRPVCPGS